MGKIRMRGKFKHFIGQGVQDNPIAEIELSPPKDLKVGDEVLVRAKVETLGIFVDSKDFGRDKIVARLKPKGECQCYAPAGKSVVNGKCPQCGLPVHSKKSECKHDFRYWGKEHPSQCAFCGLDEKKSEAEKPEVPELIDPLRKENIYIEEIVVVFNQLIRWAKWMDNKT